MTHALLKRQTTAATTRCTCSSMLYVSACLRTYEARALKEAVGEVGTAVRAPRWRRWQTAMSAAL
jgi:hypothetical protein